MDRTRDLFNFGTPSTSLKRLKLQSLNLMYRFTTRRTIEKCKIEGQRGRGLGQVTYFSILGSPTVMAKATNFKYGMLIDY